MQFEDQIKRGIDCLRTGRIDEGADVFKSVLAEDPDHHEAIRLFGTAQHMAGNNEVAVEYLSRASDSDKDDIKSATNLGAAYMALARVDEARTALENAYRIDPGDADVNHNLGLLAERIGDVDKAAEHYRTAIDGDPELTDGYLRLGRVLTSAKRNVEALKLLRDAVERFPDDLDIRYTLGMLAGGMIPGWHSVMLADQARNDAYQAAIESKVRPGDIVLDIGTGSGLLAMMAARAGAEHVYACEMNEPLAAVAEEIVALNGFADKITILRMNSIRMEIGKELPRPADVLIAEIFDNAILGENALLTFHHALRNLVVEDAQVVPEKATVFGVVVECEFYRRTARIDEVNGFDLSLMSAFRQRLGYLAFDVERVPHRVLTEPFVVAEFDFTRPPELSTVNEVMAKGCAAGTGVAVIMSFDLDVGAGHRISTRAAKPEEHWKPVIQELDGRLDISPGDDVALRIESSELYYHFAPK